MKKRVFVLTLLAVMLISTTVYGFSDVNQSDWFYKDVTYLKEQGIVAGYSDDTFRPKSNVSNSEALKMVMGIAGIEVGNIEPNTHWASNYFNIALEKDIYPRSTKSDILDTPVTRKSVANMVVKVLELDNRNVTSSIFNDTDDESVSILAEIGIINGIRETDGLYFKPNDLITRAEISAILVRLQNYKLNKKIDDKEENKESNKNNLPYMSKLITDDMYSLYGLHNVLKESEIKYGFQPMSEEELSKVLLYMASNGVYEYTVNYPNTSIDIIKGENYKEAVTKGFNIVFTKYPEYFSLTNKLSYKMSGTASSANVTFMLSNPYFTTKQLEEMRVVFIDKVSESVIKLAESGKLKKEMSDKDKAKVLYDWVAANTTYDYSFKSESYTGYGQIIHGLAVCQGYTSTYNYMSKLVGLDVQGISGIAGEEHIWTLLTTNNKKVHIDVTWGDGGDRSTPNYDYFYATTDFMRRTHSWDSSKFGI